MVFEFVTKFPPKKIDAAEISPAWQDRKTVGQRSNWLYWWRSVLQQRKLRHHVVRAQNWSPHYWHFTSQNTIYLRLKLIWMRDTLNLEEINNVQGCRAHTVVSHSMQYIFVTMLIDVRDKYIYIKCTELNILICLLRKKKYSQ